MLTRRGRVLAVAAVGAWVVSRLFGVPEVAMAAVAIGALVLLAAGYTAVTSARIQARRELHPPQLFHDAEAEIELRVRNAGRLSTAVLQIEDSVPAHLGDPARFVLSPLAPGERATLRYHLRGRHRGRFDVGPLHVRLRDPFGIAVRGQELSQTNELVVYPPVWRLPPGLPLGGRRGSRGEGRPLPQPTGDELATVREYVRGDDLRKVHWRSTAHRGKLMVRQDEAPQTPRGVIVLDRRAGAHHGSGPASSFEAAVSAAASTAYHLAEQSYRVVVMTEPTTTPPRPLTWQLALARLAVVEPSRAVDLEALWTQVGQGLAGEGVLVAVVTVPQARELRQMVRAGRAFGVRVALLVDADSHTGRRSQQSAVGRAADALASAGWRVAVLRHGDRLDDRWRELLAQRTTRSVAS